MLILPFVYANKAVKQNEGRLNVISISNDSLHVDPNLCLNHLLLKMDDIQDWHIERFDKELHKKGIIYPEKEHVLDAIKFDKENKVHIVHCAAGISRSPAIAYAIYRSRGMSEGEAMNQVKKDAPNCDPNSRIIRLTEEIF